MAQDMFRIYRGLELDETTQLLQGSGAPGVADDSSLAPVGSEYSDNTNGDFYLKVLAGTGADKWKRMATMADVTTATSATISWREPVQVRNGSSTVLPVGVAATPIVVDGISIVDGGRVLFASIVGGAGPNVYLYNQSTGVFVEDVNNETVGDTVYVSNGTSSGKRYTYTATGWVQSDGTTVDELGFIRSFIGKDAVGTENPNYSSVNIITQGSNLETTIGQLDAKIGGNVTTNTIISNTNTTHGNIQALANFVQNDSRVVNISNVTTITNIDSVVGVVARWIIRVVQVGTPANVQSLELFATHNGIVPDHTKYAVLKLGGSISGFAVEVSLSGGNTLNLTISSTAAVDVVAKRVVAV